MIGRKELQRVAQPDDEPLEAQDPDDALGSYRVDRPFRQNPVSGLEIAKKLATSNLRRTSSSGTPAASPQEEVRFLRL